MQESPLDFAEKISREFPISFGDGSLVNDARSPIVQSACTDTSERKKSRVKPFYGYEMPGDREWLVQDLICKGFPTLISADGGSGKSFFALFLGATVAMGKPLFGLKTVPTSVLYLDFELDYDEQVRRIDSVLKGMGASNDDPRFEGRFHYLQLKESLARDSTNDEIIEAIKDFKVGLVILDSLSVACSGVDVSSQADITKIFQNLANWETTTLMLDHVSKASSRGNIAQSTSLGSRMKYNMSRSVLNMRKTDSGGILLKAVKNNFGPVRDLLGYSMEFEEKKVSFIQRSLSDEEMSAAIEHLSSVDQTLAAIQAIYKETSNPVTHEEIVAWRSDQEGTSDIKSGTARNHFTQLAKRNSINRDLSGKAIPRLITEPANQIRNTII